MQTGDDMQHERKMKSLDKLLLWSSSSSKKTEWNSPASFKSLLPLAFSWNRRLSPIHQRRARHTRPATVTDTSSTLFHFPFLYLWSFMYPNSFLSLLPSPHLTRWTIHLLVWQASQPAAERPPRKKNKIGFMLRLMLLLLWSLEGRDGSNHRSQPLPLPPPPRCTRSLCVSILHTTWNNNNHKIINRKEKTTQQKLRGRARESRRTECGWKGIKINISNKKKK